MATHENRRALGAYLGIDLAQIPPTIETYVGHQYFYTLPLEALPLGVGEPYEVVVDVAIDRNHPLSKGGHRFCALLASNITRTPNLIDLGEKITKRFVEGAVKVRYDTYS